MVLTRVTSKQMPFVEIEDVDHAAAYLREQLVAGSSLAQLVERSVNLSIGRSRVAMPRNVSQRGDFDLRWDTFSLSGDEDGLFAQVVKSFIQNQSCGVFFQTEVQTTYPAFSSLPHRAPAKVYQQEVYWFAQGPELSRLSEDQILDVVYDSSFWPFSAFFCLSDFSNHKHDLSDSDLLRIAQNLAGIAVGAFDDRSYLVWWRDDLRPFPVIES